MSGLQNRGSGPQLSGKEFLKRAAASGVDQTFLDIRGTSRSALATLRRY
jgi:hypothetical protein